MNPLPTEPSTSGAPMPAWLEFFLTKRLPCAFLVLFMLTSSVLFGVLLGDVPLLGFILILAGTVLMTAVPAVFAAALFGGGLTYALQVAAIVALGILLLSSVSTMILLIFVGFFVLPTLWTALRMQMQQGFHHAAWSLALALFALVWIALWFNMDANSLKASVQQMFTAPFAQMLKGIPVGEAQAIEQIKQLQDNIVYLFPGALMFSLWLTWWGNLLYARKLAVRYGFFRGDHTPMLAFALPKQTIYVLLGMGAVANVATGNVQYIAINGLLLLACLFAVQGIAVVHCWLTSKAMLNSIVMMYVMLFFWAPIIVLFMVVGLLDIWFNFRRNMLSTTGEK